MWPKLFAHDFEHVVSLFSEVSPSCAQVTMQGSHLPGPSTLSLMLA